MVSTPTESSRAVDVPPGSATRPRIVSIDALRGLIVFTMIFVNDLAGAPHEIVPAWMRHFAGRSGMTFVDLVFPGFLFVVGMSIPFALGSRLRRGDSLAKTLLHVLIRSLSLLVVGIMMVHDNPSTDKMGWSATAWSVLMYLAALLAFSAISLPEPWDHSERHAPTLRIVGGWLRVAGFLGLISLALVFRVGHDERILSLSPFSIQSSWYGILGLIGWAYGVGALVFLVFRCHRTALLGGMVLLLCLYPAARTGAFDGWWLGHIVGIGDTLGALPSITVAGLLLATVLLTPDTAGLRSRVRFTLWFIAGCSAGALLLNGLYGINKNRATPSWCLWACAITAALWLLFHWLADVRPAGRVARTLALAGGNVLLAYLLSEMLPSVLDLLGIGDGYGHLAGLNLACALARSAACAVVVLAATAGLNRLGFRLRL
jgi:predicted acyltransferase